jgi:hypothetical protein
MSSRRQTKEDRDTDPTLTKDEQKEETILNKLSQVIDTPTTKS